MKSLVYHPHLLCILGVADTSDGKICLVVEYCSKGDLLRFLRNNRILILEVRILFILLFFVDLFNDFCSF